jgi:hypothetical protein
MIRLLTIALFPVLTACSTQKIETPNVPVVAPKTTVIIPEGLIAPCPSLAKLDASKSYNQGDTLDVIAKWVAQYDLCSDRFRRYVDLTGKALNINEVPVNTPDTSK